MWGKYPHIFIVKKLCFLLTYKDKNRNIDSVLYILLWIGGEKMQECNLNIARMLKVLHTAIKTKGNQNLAKKNITGSQMDILVFIANEEAEGKEINQVDIQKQFSLTNPTVTGILNRLQDKKIIKRVPSKKDARFNKIVLTKSGKEFMDNCKEEIEKYENKIVKNLSEEEKEELIRLLGEILKNVNEESD